MTSGLTFELTAAQRAQLIRQANGALTPQAQVVRCHIVLALADGMARAEVARRYEVSVQTVDKWARRYVAEGPAGLRDRPRPGAPRRIEDATIAEVLRITRHEPPPVGRNWSKRTLAQRVGVSASTVARIWRAHGITPGAGARSAAPTANDATGSGPPPITVRAIYVNETLCVLAFWSSMNPMAPFSFAPILSENRPVKPSADPDSGAGRLSTALDALAAVAGRKPSSGGRSTPGFPAFLHRLSTTRPTNTDLHLICYAGNPATLLALHRWHFEQPRLHVHLTPTHEVWLQVLQDTCALVDLHGPRPAAPQAMASIDMALRAWRRRQGKGPFVWGPAEWPNPTA
ncbi:helix-turn-helix domain-containing protein [Streptomyces djakartensis]|uniref:IS630 family transposase n=1 Tax=Streptomyces djakartensis TaxID=68193 RepID=A0ABQ3A4N8_9ACTN|nr:helix-turn-helix domain-containing protein [Streptomyces djakartensis]GGY33092.1 IS630 family transposase [Streptomyces djakartensis]